MFTCTTSQIGTILSLVPNANSQFETRTGNPSPAEYALTFDWLMNINNKMEEVCLVIRAPNKKVEDFEVKCNLSWTLHQLKDHLVKNYPTKPVRLFSVHCFQSIIISHSWMPLIIIAGIFAHTGDRMSKTDIFRETCCR